jgi:hypothetical protein
MGRLNETVFPLVRASMETSRSYFFLAFKPAGTVMARNGSLLRYLMIRTAAFLGLTAASTAVMALPYLG